jgi:predicted ATPase/DNA-binding CsgD family transcriptional regulator
MADPTPTDRNRIHPVAPVPLPLRERAEPRLPLALTSFVGRERELSAVCDAVQRADVRLVTLTGPGGVGKTRIAQAVAAEVAAAFPDGAWFVGLAEVRDPALVAPAIAQAFGVWEGGDAPLVDRLALVLRDRRLLLLLDNVEHVVTSAPVVTTLLGACPGLTVLATSRVRLRVSGEHEYVVPPLEVAAPAQTDSAADVSRSEAVRLFVARAQAVETGFALTEANAGMVADICRRLDGLPLAIELAAARVKVLPPPALLARLERRLPLLTGGGRDLPARQQTMRATIAWSHDLLTSEEQTLFRRLAVFVGGFSLEAAEVVCQGAGTGEQGMGEASGPVASVLDGVASLVDQSLVQKTEQPDGAPRFTMLETVREFGLERLADSGETAAANRRLAAWAVALAHESVPGLRGPEQRRWLDRLAGELPNLRAALGWLAESGEAEGGAELAATLFDFWLAGGHPDEGRGWLDRFLEGGAQLAPATRASALWATGMLASIQGAFPRAMDAAEESLALARRIERPLAVADALNLLGLALGTAHEATHPGDTAGVRALVAPLYAEALELYRAHGDRYWTAWVLANEASFEEDPDRQAARWEESLALFRATGDATGVAVVLSNLGEQAGRRGAWSVAAPSFAEALTLSWRDGDRWTLPSCLESLGRVALLGIGQAERAVRLFAAASAVRASTGFPPQTQEAADLSRDLAAARARLGDDAFDAAWEAGRVLPVEQAVAAALGLAEAVPSPSVSAPHGLTRRESEVLQLLAEGRSDREIAEALFISPRTVGVHLANVLGKLGLASRAAAVAFVHRHGLAEGADGMHAP